MKNPVSKHLRHAASGTGALLAGIAQQAHAAGVPLQPTVPAAYSTGTAAAGAALSAVPSILLWGPLLLLALVCIAALLILILQQGDAAPGQTHSARFSGQRIRLGGIGTSGAVWVGWNRRSETVPVSTRQSRRAAELVLSAHSAPGAVPESLIPAGSGLTVTLAAAAVSGGRREVAPTPPRPAGVRLQRTAAAPDLGGSSLISATKR